MKTINTGEFNATYPINEIQGAKVNRDLFIKHAENFKQKLLNYGWMMPLVITPKGNLIEGHHRLQTAIMLGQKTVPVYIVSWVDVDIDEKYLDTIINLNNSNRAWSSVDYLKSFATQKEDYKFVYETYLKNKDSISVGNLIWCFFAEQKNSGFSNAKFKTGDCRISDLEFSNHVLDSILKLVDKYGKRRFQAYTVRALIQCAFQVMKKDKEVFNLVLQDVDRMAYGDDRTLSSIEHIKPTLRDLAKKYIKLKSK